MDEIMTDEGIAQGINTSTWPAATRTCKICGYDKPLDSFFKNNLCKGGYESMCKPCKIKRERYSRGEDITEEETPFRASKKWDVAVLPGDFERLGALLSSQWRYDHVELRDIMGLCGRIHVAIDTYLKLHEMFGLTTTCAEPNPSTQYDQT